MDYRKQLCKCTKCKLVLIDTIPNNTCLRIPEDEIPKKILSLNDLGCPKCNSWDNLEDVHDIIILKYDDYRTAKEKGPIEYPGAIFFKAMAPGGTSNGNRKLKEYHFIS